MWDHVTDDTQWDHVTDDTQLISTPSEASDSVQVFVQCLKAITAWIGRNWRWLNPSKMECLCIFGPLGPRKLTILTLDGVTYLWIEMVHNLRFSSLVAHARKTSENHGQGGVRGLYKYNLYLNCIYSCIWKHCSKILDLKALLMPYPPLVWITAMHSI